MSIAYAVSMLCLLSMLSIVYAVSIVYAGKFVCLLSMLKVTLME